jgi:hypothetical protein
LPEKLYPANWKKFYFKTYISKIVFINKWFNMDLRYSLITFFTIFIFFGCAFHTTQIREVPDSDIPIKIQELRTNLMENGVPGQWFDKQIKHKTFQLHEIGRAHV